MTTSETREAAIASPPRRRGRDGKLDLWICWWVFPVFYTLFGVIFVLLTRVMPPPPPGVDTAQIVRFFDQHRVTIQIGFVALLIVIGFGALLNGLVAYQMKRMSVKPVFAYAYIATLAVGGIPGCLFAAFSFLAATFRPDRDPHLIALLYDTALLTFVGSLGCFTAQYIVLAVAILLDKNRVFPSWLAYISIWVWLNRDDAKTPCYSSAFAG
jgi:ABC-type Fe3+ transport system permease subunit